MSTHDPDHDLLARLRALPAERSGPADGWERLSARLPPREPVAVQAPVDNVVALPLRTRRRWWLPVGAALAASVHGVDPGPQPVTGRSVTPSHPARR